MNGDIGNDYFYSSGGTDITMNGGAGDDTVQNYGPNVTIYGGDGNDYIENEGNTAGLNGYTEIYGDAGDDIIKIKGDHATVIGGTGNDYLYGQTTDGTVYKYNAGDGKDTIGAFQANDTLVVAGGNYTTTKSGDYLLVIVGEGYILMRGAADITPIIQGTLGDSSQTTVPTITSSESSLNKYIEGLSLNNKSDDTVINGSDGNDGISNYGSNVTINSYHGNDGIYNYGSTVKIYAGDGKDTIHNLKNSNVTIDGGAGDDTILIGTTRDDSINGGYIDGGAGNDIVYLQDLPVFTISGGEGDDSINNSSTDFVYLYNEGDANDTLSNFNANTTLIIGGASYSTTKSNSGFIIQVGEGSILLKGGLVENQTPIIQGTFKSNAAIDQTTTPAETSTSSTGNTTTETSNPATNYVGIGNNNSIAGNVVINNYYDNSTNITNNLFTYQSGNDTINNFNSGDKLNFAATYTDWITTGSDLVINAAEGSVRITEAQNKLIELADASGNLISHVYMAKDYQGAIEGR